MLEEKYKNFYLAWRNLPLDDPMYPIYEAVTYLLEDIDDYEAQFKELFGDVKTINDDIENIDVTMDDLRSDIDQVEGEIR